MEGASRPVHRAELDGLRALAVLGVVIFHASCPVALGHDASRDQAIGAHGVDLFFVLSGFCLSYPMNPDAMKSAADYLTFLRRRVTRIAPAFYVALLLFAGLAATSFGLPSHIGPLASPQGQTADLARDALFFPTLQPMHDVPMWTLGVEMRWYVVFPIVLVLFYRLRIAFVAIFALSYYGYREAGLLDCAFLSTFMLGIVAAHLVKIEAKINAVWPPVALAAIVAAVVQQHGTPAIDHASVLWQAACFATVLAVTTNSRLRRTFACRPLVAVGIASYSIYLVHQPFLDAMVWAGAPPVLAAIAAVGIGGLFWYAVERPLCASATRRAMDRALVGAYHAVTFGRLRVAPPLALAPTVAHGE